MADIIKAILDPVVGYLVGPIIREGQHFFCVKKKFRNLEKLKMGLISERERLQDRVQQANEGGHIIEKPVEEWLNNVSNLLQEVADLEQRIGIDNNGFLGLCPTFKRYRLSKQIKETTKAIGEFKGKSNIEPFSHPAPLPGIQYESSEHFICFDSTKVAFSQLMEALKDDCTFMIGVYGMGGCGKTTLVTQVGKTAEPLNLFDKVILLTVTHTPNIRNIQQKVADMLNLKLEEGTEEGRAQRIWLSSKEKKRLLIIVDDLWGKFELRDVGICLDNNYKGRWKVLMTTRSRQVCNSMNCQEIIQLGLLSEAESWTLFKKHANIDDKFSKSMNDVPRRLCEECKGLPIAIAAMGSSLRGKSYAEWEVALDSLKHYEEIDDHMNEGVRDALSCIKLSYDYLKNKEAELLFLICSMFREDYEISIEGLFRYVVGLGLGGRLSIQSARSRIQAAINKLLDSCLLMHATWEFSYFSDRKQPRVKMHDVVRDAALWIAMRSENNKILVNLEKPLGTLTEDYITRDYFAVSSWYNDNQISLQFGAPNLQILLLEIRPEDSLDISHATFEGIKKLKALAVIYAVTDPSYFFHHHSLSLPRSIELLANLRTVRLINWILGDISFITSLTRLEVLDLKGCTLNELPSEMGKLERLKMLDISYCHFKEEKYNGAIGKCLLLEELYARKSLFSTQISMDIITHSNLQKFAIYSLNSYLFELTNSRDYLDDMGVLELEDFDFSNLMASKRNLLKIATDVSLKRCSYGGCKNIILGVVGAMKNMRTLRLDFGDEIECIWDATSDSNLLDSDQVEALFPKLVELSLIDLTNLKEVCRGPPLHVLQFFENLEKVIIFRCPQLCSIFPKGCGLQNLKILRLENEPDMGHNVVLGDVLFSMSVAQSLQQLEELSIKGYDALKHIIESGTENGSNTSNQLSPAQRNSSMMPNLKIIWIVDCGKIEFLFRICCAKGLVKLQKLRIEYAPELKYVFDKCDHEDHSSHQYESQIMLPNLNELNLKHLEGLVGMCPESYPVKWPSQLNLILKYCPNFDEQVFREATVPKESKYES